ncbi:ribonuclease P protein subunit p25-like protein [Strongylocentrotus purpuratus]|uniref:DNA/RNA-binding protein Alba-like domain-containing protein n=1 Tax=Strongylocentrotus purpuratus TaxID=7668 RepID=A0A7M7P4K7_STRPU|nr:ribonuclease P protein subunit p25-like protein [Strongylocentrotus purpuratus]
MEHYEKGKVMEVDDPDGPFLHLGVRFGEVITMKVRNGSKIRNLLQFATKKMEEDGNRSIIFTGTGMAITKTVTCVEIMKREMKNLHQINKAYFRRTEEYWEPKEEGLDRLKVNKDVPALAVLLSKDPMDGNELGYQAPGSFETRRRDEARQDKRKKNQQRQQVGRGGDGQSRSARSVNQRQDREGQGSMAQRKRQKKRGDQKDKGRTPGEKQGSGGDRTKDGGKEEKKENREDEEMR